MNRVSTTSHRPLEILPQSDTEDELAQNGKYYVNNVISCFIAFKWDFLLFWLDLHFYRQNTLFESDPGRVPKLGMTMLPLFK